MTWREQYHADWRGICLVENAKGLASIAVFMIRTAAERR